MKSTPSYPACRASRRRLASRRALGRRLAGRRAIKELGETEEHLDEYADATSARYAAMVERVRQRLGLTTLEYQKLGDLVAAIGLSKEKLCTYCWDGAEVCPTCPVRAAREEGMPVRPK